LALDEQTRAEILATFRIELAEHCQALIGIFLALEKEPESDERGQLLDEALRSAHSLKGAARAVAFGAVEALAHGLEGVLEAARDAALELSPKLVDLLYEVVDTLSGAFDDDGVPALFEVASQDLIRQLLIADTRPIGPSAPRGVPPAAGEPLTATTSSAVIVAGPWAGGAAPTRPNGRSASAASAGETVRLPAARLDALLEQLGELIVPRMEITEGLARLAVLRGELDAWQRDWRKARPLLRPLERDGTFGRARPLVRFLERNEAHLAALGPELAALHARLAGPTAQLCTLVDGLQTDMRQVRLVTFGTGAAGLERAVRDLVRGADKDARLILVGAETEVDRRVIEGTKDALLHLLRNAVDHGIESRSNREKLGKPSIGSLVVTAAQRGATVVIEVEDDGAGLDAGAVRRAATARGLISDVEAAAMTDAEALKLIFLPGLSTRNEVSEVSGRGVGLDVVAHAVEQLSGRVEVESRPAEGTRFTMTVPLTLATTRAVIVEAAGAPYALPTTAVERVMRPKRLGTLAGRPVMEHDGHQIPVAMLASLVDPLGGHAAPDTACPGVVAILAIGAQRAAVGIDRVVGEDSVVVKPLGYPLLRVRYFAGATILGSGRVVPILNARDLVRAALRAGGAVVTARPVESDRPRRRVLVVDDSLTTRTLERYILEAAGYEVEVAGDGAEALALLQERVCDLLVSDVEMPLVDGVALTAAIRLDPKLRALPVILVTTRESAPDQQRGLEAGADAYIAKSSFDQDNLLRTIADLI
jgi:two-component system chemotaxis sensor kinase CheA